MYHSCGSRGTQRLSAQNQCGRANAGLLLVFYCLGRLSELGYTCTLGKQIQLR
jgi:hypothetical protein